MRVLLVSANTLTQPYPVYPLGLDYVAGAIEERHEVRIVDLNVPRGEAALFDLIDGFAPEVIGVSIRNVDNSDASQPRGFYAAHRELAEAIRRRSRAVLVLGGSGFTIFPAELMRALGADYGIIGEGERLSQLLDAMADGKEVPAAPGIITADSPALVPAPWGRPIRRSFDPRRPHVAYYLEKGAMLNLQTKRGCRFNCIYCTYPHIEGKDQRLFDPREVARTARRLQEAGARFFFVTDSAFNSSVSHSLEVAEAFRQAGVSIPWGAFLAPIDPPQGYFRSLAAAGLTHVEFGTESLSDPVLAAYHKHFRAEHVFAAHAAAVGAGLHVAHYFLLGGPGETSDTVNETLGRVERLDRCALFFFCGMRIYPRTGLCELTRREGQAGDTRSLLAPTFFRPPGLEGRVILERVEGQAGGRPNWVIGDGGEKTADVVARLHAHGHAGPLWEYLVR